LFPVFLLLALSAAFAPAIAAEPARDAPCGVYLWQHRQDAAFAASASEALAEGRECFVFAGEWDGAWQGALPPEELLASPRVTPVFRLFPKALAEPGAALRALARRIASFPAPPMRLQLDCDAPERKLAEYAELLRAARGLLPPGATLSATFLPAHLGRPGLDEALAQTDFAVLQVHGLLAPETFSSPASLMTRGSVEKALAAAMREEKWRLSVPSYALVASYDEAGGAFLRFHAETAGEPADRPIVAADGSLSADGKKFRLLAPDGELLAEIFAALPPERILWYRWPARGDRWVFPAETMRAWEAGKAPELALSVFPETNNDGRNTRVLASWEGGIPFAPVRIRLRWETTAGVPTEWFFARAWAPDGMAHTTLPGELWVPPFSPGEDFVLGTVLPATGFTWEQID
jgi:hypothetical protein